MKIIKFIALVFFLYSCSSVKNISLTDKSNIIALMNQSAKDWNSGSLDRFMALYDTAATFMFSSGPVGLQGIRENYQKVFFDGDKPKQQLRFENMEIRSLGKDHALLTGKFVLEGINLNEKRGIYTLVFVRRASGWQILHDHSS